MHLVLHALNSRRGLVALVIFAAAALLWLPAAFGDGAVFSDGAIFEPVDTTANPTAGTATPNTSGQIRGRVVQLNPGALSPSARELTINLFDDTVLQAKVDRVDRSPGVDGYVWVGRVPGGRVTLSVRGDRVAGSVLIGGADQYTISYTGMIDGRPAYAVRQLDASKLPQPGGRDHLFATPPADRGDDPLTCEDGSRIDVMIVYTAAARDHAGDMDAMLALINQRISEMNSANTDSQARFSWRLVRAMEVDYQESGSLYTDLQRLQNASDGYLDEVHQARDEAEADIVALLVSMGNGGSCGIAYQMNALESWFQSYAFGVTALDYEAPYACSSLTLTHELGHVMGNAHDRAHADVNNVLFPYSFGHQSPERTFRTIMSYDCEGGCPRINQWANPDVVFQGEPTGIDHDINPAAAADIVRSMNETARTVANFRADCPAATETPIPTPTDAPPTETPLPTATPVTETPPPPTNTPEAPPTETPPATTTPEPTPAITATPPAELPFRFFLPLIMEGDDI